jgi:hypothetical protein
MHVWEVVLEGAEANQLYILVKPFLMRNAMVDVVPFFKVEQRHLQTGTLFL